MSFSTNTTTWNKVMNKVQLPWLYNGRHAGKTKFLCYKETYTYKKENKHTYEIRTWKSPN